jgi:hypothetical protein
VCGCCCCRCPPAAPNPTCFLQPAAPGPGHPQLVRRRPALHRQRQGRAGQEPAHTGACFARAPRRPLLAPARSARLLPSPEREACGRWYSAASTVSSTPRRKLRAPPVTLRFVLRDGRWQTSRRRSRSRSPTSYSWSSAALSCR